MVEITSAHQRPLRTPLYDLHVQAGAKMTDFAGWLMPIQYRSIILEHQAVRSSVGLFDLSHMGRLLFRGPEATELVQWLTVNDVRRLADGQAQYSLFCNEQGGILDDVVIYLRGDQYLIVVNASNRDKLWRWIQARRLERGLRAEVVDETLLVAMIGVQGPLSEETLQPLVSIDLQSLGYYWSRHAMVAGADATIARTGYTGEDGFEVMLPAESAAGLWQHLLSQEHPARPTPCGLGARDTLRLEAGMPLYGHEITESSNPYEAGLGRVVKLDKGDFIGRSALAALHRQPLRRRLTAFQMVENGVPRQGYLVLAAGREVGWVTSGGFGPSLRANIGMAYVPVELAELGREFDVLVRERPVRARAVPLPFYPHHTRRKT